jgi:hypothetical protein
MRRLTSRGGIPHPTYVAWALKHAAILVLALATAAGNLAACGGWQLTPEARMACCTEGAECPMHRRDGDRGASQQMSQAAADACCASSEDQDATSSANYVLAAAEALSVETFPALALSAWEPALVLAESPPPPRSISRHLFLSVFLI